jgi:hypothetical protein
MKGSFCLSIQQVTFLFNGFSSYSGVPKSDPFGGDGGGSNSTGNTPLEPKVKKYLSPNPEELIS